MGGFYVTSVGLSSAALSCDEVGRLSSATSPRAAEKLGEQGATNVDMADNRAPNLAEYFPIREG
jgi:hypothetical protein